MKSDNVHPDYFFGNTDAEHERLIRQAIRLAPVIETLLRDAGIAPGNRVLELGSGVGDVAMLVARIVGRSGEVVAIERDAHKMLPSAGWRQRAPRARRTTNPQSPQGAGVGQTDALVVP